MLRLFKKTALFILLGVLVVSPLFPLHVHGAERLQVVPERPVIVIDPGHGGNNQGTVEGEQDEKYMTMTTALAMYEELCLYDNVDVYLTRTEDKDISLKERAEFAKSVNADFLFSIHYNASENHELFGAEIWIPSKAPFNGYGYQFGYEFLSQLEERGLFIRGIKTRLDDKGRDYYGIIRESAALEIPAVILEHCHVDESRDSDFCDSEEDLITRGREDATAVAKYLGLKSSVLNVDYSEYQLTEAEESVPVSGTLRDETSPDVCMIEFLKADYEKCSLSLTVSAADYDTPLLYYDYSTDGGITYSTRQPWPGSNALDGSYEDTFTLNLTVSDGSRPNVIVRAYNLFDLFTESNHYDSPKTFAYPKETTEEEVPVSQEETFSPEDGSDAAEAVFSKQAEEQREPGFMTFLEICLAVVILLFVILLISQAVSYHYRKKRRRQRRKDEGATRNQHR